MLIRSKKLLVAIFIILIFGMFLFFIFILNSPKFSIEPLDIHIDSIQNSYLKVKVILKVTNHWLFPVSINGGSGTVYFNDVKIGFFELPPVTLEIGENNITTDLFLENNTTIYVYTDNIIRIHAKINTLFGVIKVEKLQHAYFSEEYQLFNVIDAYSLSSGCFLLLLKLNYTSWLMLNVNYSLSFFAEYNNSILFYAHGCFNISWSDFAMILKIPSNESINTLIQVFKNGKPINIHGNITLSYENWFSLIRFNFNTTFPEFLPRFNATIIDIDLVDEYLYVYACLLVQNDFSIEANISSMLFKIYTDNTFVGKAIAYNQTIYAKTVNKINVTIIIAPENITKIIKNDGRILIKGTIIMQIIDTFYIIHIKEYYQLQL